MINVKGDFFDRDVVAFVRRLNKPLGDKTHVLQLKLGYSLSPKGKSSSIFLTAEEAQQVISQIVVDQALRVFVR